MERTRDLTSVPGKITGAVCLLIGVLFVVLPTITDSLHHTNIEAGIGPSWRLPASLLEGQSCLSAPSFSSSFPPRVSVRTRPLAGGASSKLSSPVCSSPAPAGFCCVPSFICPHGRAVPATATELLGSAVTKTAASPPMPSLKPLTNWATTWCSPYCSP